MKEKNFISSLHKSTSRDCLGRMNDDKVNCMIKARKFDKEFWDGNRRYGYGGYKYIPGRWKKVAKKLIKNYNLGAGSKVLDAGCGKGFLLKEMLDIEPSLDVYGFDISKYAIKNAHKDVKKNFIVHPAQKKFPYKDLEFDLTISLATLHNLEIFDLKKSLEEIERVSKKKYIMIESYRNEKELFNLQCWALTANAFFSKKAWIWLFKEFNYSGDYEFIYF
ncbi:MAG: SAM-dependent methyltransferase [Euryarchaeota archaeon]|nr:SAM-dependent methyltransferase [Euryarchaeota archaeon]MAZ07574.1 SAM-dependent methyltransferase [Rickettsiales bacterium]OUU12514.1 MAG: SAM-dependent methyltransferase [Gammaproteobacteria bacterium TMED34]|tara:strand:- start:2322 stop:2981 length:660 start_codon:yes stop_codon:yes gene_type:complete